MARLGRRGTGREAPPGIRTLRLGATSAAEASYRVSVPLSRRPATRLPVSAFVPTTVRAHAAFEIRIP